MAVRYRRVPLSEEAENPEEDKKKQAERIERITAKIHALFWVILSALICYYTDIITIITMDDGKVIRSALNLAIICIMTNICIIFYLTIYLPFFMRINTPWEIYCPRMIPASTALGVLSIISAIVAFWPLWGLLTPLVIMTLCMGILFSTHFIPWPC
jgi:hypothetical protein